MHRFMESRNNESYTECQVINPVYGSNTEEQNYSSSGPTYELVDNSKGKGPLYSVLERCQESETEMAKTATENKEHHYHVLESGRGEGVTQGGCDEGGCKEVTEGVCDYEVPVSGQTLSRVKLCDEEDSTLQH